MVVEEPIVLVQCIFSKFIILILRFFFFIYLEIMKVKISLKLQRLPLVQATKVLTLSNIYLFIFRL
jgi:hypothetical protein